MRWAPLATGATVQELAAVLGPCMLCPGNPYDTFNAIAASPQTGCKFVVCGQEASVSVGSVAANCTVELSEVVTASQSCSAKSACDGVIHARSCQIFLVCGVSGV
jgi:hypothetical protein